MGQAVIFLFFSPIAEIGESDKKCKEHQQFSQCNIHTITSPRNAEGRQKTSPLCEKRERQPPPLWCSSGTLASPFSFYHTIRALSTFSGGISEHPIAKSRIFYTIHTPNKTKAPRKIPGHLLCGIVKYDLSVLSSINFNTRVGFNVPGGRSVVL